MTRIIVFFMVSFLSIPIRASDEKSYSQGQSFAGESKIPLPSDVAVVPGYKDPSTVSINEKYIDQQAQNASQSNQEADFLRKTYNTRARFDLDIKTDPLFTGGDKVVLNPEKSLNLSAQTKAFSVGVSQHICTKGYDLLERKCRWTNVPVKTGTKKEEKTEVIYIHNYERKQMATTTFSNAQNEPKIYLSQGIDLFKKYYTGKDALSGQVILINTNRIISFRLLSIKTGQYPTYSYSNSDKSSYVQETWWSYPKYIQLEVKELIDVPVYTFSWKNDCDALEGKADTGACEASEKRCIEEPQTRIIDGTPIYSNCWAEEAVYHCKSQEEDTCKILAAKGCFQTGSKCLVTLDKGHCIKWQQTFECQSGKRQSDLTTLAGDKPFCLDGHCVDQSWDGNRDMIDSLSKLAIFKEMQKGLQAQAGIVFKGKSLGCSRVIASFKDCCRISGWGKDIGLASCHAEEKELQEERKKDKCHFVGTYCADRVMGVCTRKKSTYCCYPSKLSKLINVQGKRQLGLSFGSPEEPKCGGLTLDQITKVDFSKLDLSELFSELFANMKTPDTGTLSKDIKKSMENKTYTITNKEITQGRSHGSF